MNDQAVASDQSADMAPNLPAFEGSAIPPEELERLSDDIVQALKTIYDP